MKKRYTWVVFSVFTAYFAMLWLLVYAESFSPDANILSLKDALWYSLVTLTTVGYGDLSPVTAVGKVIGGVFLLLSTSLLAILVALAITFGQLLTRLRLWLAQSEQWYVFSSVNRAAITLAGGIAEENKNAVLVFPKDDNKDFTSRLKKLGANMVKGSVDDILLLKKDTAGTNLFFMSDDGYANYRDALRFSGKNLVIFCKSDFNLQSAPADITFFSRSESCARLYWNSNPLPRSTKNVVIIGDGACADAVLAQALQVNIFRPDQSINYYVFSKNHSFIKLHPQLSRQIAINQSSECSDSLWFCPYSWEDGTDIVMAADRVIICCEKDEDNLKIYSNLTEYFALSADVHLRLYDDMPGVHSFGNHSRLYTPAMVMRTTLAKTAAAMHRIYLDSTGADSPRWEELSPFTRRSNISAADHLQTKIRILMDDDTITAIDSNICRQAFEKYMETKAENSDFYRSLEHSRWMRFHALYNWTYAPQRDNSRRRHPSMVLFAQLDKAIQSKDDYSWQLLEQLADFLDN